MPTRVSGSGIRSCTLFRLSSSPATCGTVLCSGRSNEGLNVVESWNRANSVIFSLLTALLSRPAGGLRNGEQSLDNVRAALSEAGSICHVPER
jgi:hypothetical protein